MDQQNLYGIKYEVDIEDLKTSTAEASKKIKMANAEFNESSSKLDNWSTSVDGVSAKIKQMNTILEAEKSKLAQSQKSYNDTIDSIKNYQKEIDELKEKKKQAIATYGAESDEVKQLSVEINKLERVQETASESADRLKVSIANKQATVNKTEKSIKNYENQLEDVKEAQKRAEKSGKSLEDELKDLKNASDKSADSTEKMSDGFTVAKGVIANFIADGISNLISGLKNAIEETREYRAELGKLEATAQTTNASFANVKDNLREVNSITNDTGAGVEGLNNILSAGFDGKLLDEITDQLLGASIKWKDTLKFEGLADGLQETLATGKAIGPFAELLERAGGSLEDFDSGLQNAIESGNQQQYVLDYLAKYGLKDVKKAYEDNNESLIDSANATFDFNDSMAQMGERTEPILTSVKKGFVGLFDEIINGTNGVDVEGFADTIDNAFSIAKDGISWTIKNIKPLTSSVLGLGTAWGVYNGFQKTLNTVTAITTTLTKLKTSATIADTVATNGATVATKALALAQKLTPWGMVFGLITGVVVGLTAYIVSSNNAKQSTDKNTKATDELIDKQKELNDTLKENKEARDQVITSAESEGAMADVLFKKIDELNSVQNKSNAQKETMKTLVEKLNEVMPELNLQYDAEKDALNMSTDAIKSNIEAQKDLILAKASQENMMKIAQDIADLEIQQADAVAQHAINEEALAKAKSKTQKAREAFEKTGNDIHSQEYKNYLDALTFETEKTEAYNKTKEAIEKNEKKLQALNKEYDKASDYADSKINSAEIEKQLNALVETAKANGIEIPKKISEGIKEGKYAVPKSLEELNALINFQTLRDQAKKAGVGLPDSIAKGIKSGELLPSDAVNQMNALVSFSDLLFDSEMAGKKVPNILKEQIINGQLSPQQAIEIMQSWVNFNDMLNKAGLAGIAIPANIKQAILEGKMSPAEAIAELNRLVNEELDKQPPKSKEKGKNAGEGYTSGISEKETQAKTAGEGLASNAETGMNSGDWENSGKMAGNGFIGGMLNIGVLNGVMTAGATLAKFALTGLRNTGGEHSPWKTTQQSGKFAVEGLALGIEKNKEKAVNAMKKMVSKVVDTSEQLKSSIALDETKEKMKVTINGMIENEKLALAKANESVNNITFKQYNTSPKALDSLEMFRNEKKLLKQFEMWKGRK